MSKSPTNKFVLVFLVLLLALSACSNGNEPKIKKKRRSQISVTSQPQKTLPALPTTTTTLISNTVPINELPVIKPDQIEPKWNAQTLCSLVSPTQAKVILELSTTPVPKYSFSGATGARCTYASGAGDEIYVEYSTKTYQDARLVDSALGQEGQSVVISGVAGVRKSSTSTGVTFELNISGATSNEWIINGSTNEKAKKTAQVLISSLK